jgi:molybdate transport system ATP-binding protein
VTLDANLVVARPGGFRLDLSLTAQAGEVVALLGPNGAGKTTALRALAGLLPLDRGGISLDGAEIGGLPAEKRRIGVVFQDYLLFPHLTALENVAFGPRCAGAGRTRSRQIAAEWLERMDLAQWARAKPGRLSGGQAQRVALARALATSPRLLLLDEPLAALDPRTRARAARELNAILAEVPVPTVLVTHDFDEAAVVGDEVAILDHGRVVQRGSASELAAQPASAFVADLTGAIVLSGHASRGPSGLTEVALRGGGCVFSTDAAQGPVGVSVHPWDISLAQTEPAGSTNNHLRARVDSVTTIGNRARVGLHASQPLAAEITAASAERLQLQPGLEVVATWKATATRLVPL